MGNLDNSSTTKTFKRQNSIGDFCFYFYQEKESTNSIKNYDTAAKNRVKITVTALTTNGIRKYSPTSN